MKKKIFVYLSLLILVAITKSSLAQSPCASLSVTSNIPPVIPCDTTSTLTIDFNAQISLNFPVNETNTYSVGNIPYTPLPWVGANVVLNGTDDFWSGVVQLPFPFCFFGNIYTSYVIGSNGRISFNTALANQTDDWNTSTPLLSAPDPINNDMNNTIMAPYHDTDPSVGGSITWDTFGVAPCRTMVINWTSVPMFSCNTLIDSQQIVLHEFSNLIDINIANKPNCATWNSSLALEGIQNQTGTVAYTVPGRNNTVWTANNDSWRFSPSGNPYTFTTTYTWRNGVTNAILGTGSSVTLNTPFPTVLVCEAAIFGGCTNDTTFARDTTIFAPGKVNASFTFDANLGCTSDTVVFTNTTTPSASTNYLWVFGDGNFSSQTNPTHIYGVQNTYNVTLLASHPVCIGDTVTVPVNVNHPIDAIFTAAPDSVCLGESVIFSNISTATGSAPAFFLFDNFWDFGDGTSGINNQPFPTHTYANPGAYIVKLIITDSLGCQDSMTTNIYVDKPAYVEMNATPTSICVGEPVYFTDSFASHTLSTQYDFGDGNVLVNVRNPKHTYEQAGVYNATFTGFYAICDDSVITREITVNDYPAINLGEDKTICPGLTNPITLTNTLNSSQIMNWSDGTQGSSMIVSEPGYYWANATNGACSSNDSIWIKRDCYLNIPNSFTPDGDGTNDYFIPRQLLSAGLTNFDMKIYNRWGEVVFETNKIDGRGWDGRFGEKDQPMGVYVYVINAQWKNNHKNTFQGNLTLLR